MTIGAGLVAHFVCARYLWNQSERTIGARTGSQAGDDRCRARQTCHDTSPTPGQFRVAGLNNANP